ncbi:MAG: hypothetical protein ACI4TW_06310 [Prevotella sp.]
MKKHFLSVFFSVLFIGVYAQNSYVVKTRGAQKAVVTEEKSEEPKQEEENESGNFITDTFPYYSLCDWKEGMKFMVMPERYDLIVNTFCSSATGKDVSNGRLRYKIFIYKNHTVAANGKAHINFYCQDDSSNYYYEIPNGTFEDHCYSKIGVPTLAYLGDVDIARSTLVGMKLYTRADAYRVDTQYESDAFEEIAVPKNTEVTVRAIGVGTRNYPVKIIVEDNNGKEFYQNVAISKTNCGMRDDEFIMDKAQYLFSGSFEMIDAKVSEANAYSQYIGNEVYTKYATNMYGIGDNILKIPRFSSFIIVEVQPLDNSNYVTLTLRSTEDQKTYAKKVTFVNETVIGDIDGYKEDYFEYLFGTGKSGLEKVPAAHRQNIKQGKIAVGYTKKEVRLAKGNPNRTAAAADGCVDWFYDKGVVVRFNASGRVLKVLYR